MNFLRTANINASLERRISTARLNKYLALADGELDAALSQYEQNTKLSEAFYTPLQCLEICLRNTIHEQMSAAYASHWLTNGGPPLSVASLAMIDEAVAELKNNVLAPTPDDIVAELKFAFWIGLLGQHYDNTLWRKALYKGFANGGSKRRQVVHQRFNVIRRLRNRIAHHEPIFMRDNARDHAEILEAIGWMCADTQAWAAHHSRVLVVL